MKRFFSLLLLSVLLLSGLSAALAQTDLSAIQLAADARYVDLGENKLKDIEPLIAFLDQHPQLTQVDMYESRLNAQQIDALALRYPHIRFGWTLHLVEDHYVRTDATAYAINHNNRSKTHSEEDFRLLKYCRNLRALDLGHNKIKDISFMADLTELRVIIMANNYITDISPLAGLKKLEYVELFNNYIEDYAPLRGLHRLIDLNLAFNQTQDFSPLYELKGLERLWLYHSNNRSNDDPVDEALVARLQAALPDCQINHTSYSTLGGWRQHERYYVVFNMLHGAVAWLPWSAEGLVPKYN